MASVAERKPSRRSTRVRAAKAPEPPDEPEGCQHNWQIARPDAQVSHGVCSKCGEEKDFLNYGEELRLPFGRRRRR